MKKILLAGLLLFGISLDLIANDSALSCGDNNGYAIQKLKQVGGFWDDQAVQICKDIALTARLMGKNERDLFNQIISDSKKRTGTTAGNIVMKTAYLLSYAKQSQ